MISAEAAEKVVDPNFGLVLLKIHTVKSYQIYIRVRASSALPSTPQRMVEKIVVRCSGPFRVFFQQVSDAQKRSGRILPQSTNRKSLRGSDLQQFLAGK